VKAKTTLVPFNDGLALVLPQDFVNRLGLKAGDAMEASVMPQGILFTVLAADAPSQTQVAREFMEEYRETFADLAKQ
jgi:antitoxin component of MazEF toxin-antitoxin module